MIQEEIEKQAEEYCKKECGSYYYECYRECSSIEAFKAGAKWGVANAIKWHDLRKDPKDLPKEDCETVTLHENGNKNIIKWKHGEWTNAIVIPVITWCELPTYKEGEVSK